MTNSESVSASAVHRHNFSPLFHVVYEAGPWVPLAKRELLKEEADKTWWWLMDRGIWQNSDAIIKFPLDYQKDDQMIAAFPLLKRPDRPRGNLPVKYHLGSNRNIYTRAGSRFIQFGSVQSPMPSDFDEIIEMLRAVRGE